MTLQFVGSIKNKLQQRYFAVNFVKFLKHRFYRTPPGDCFSPKTKENSVFLVGLLMGMTKFLEACNYIRKRLLHSCFPVNFEKFSKSLIL